MRSTIPSGIVIIVASKKRVNELAGVEAGKTALAVYFPYLRALYITPESFRLSSRTIPHEIAHVYNWDIGIRSEHVDESLAYEFEHTYLSH